MSIPELEDRIDWDNYTYEHDKQGTWYLNKTTNNELDYVITYTLDPPGIFHGIIRTTTDTLLAGRSLTDPEKDIFKTKLNNNPIPQIEIAWGAMRLVVEQDGACYLTGRDTSHLYKVEIHIDPRIGLFATFYTNDDRTIGHRRLSPQEAGEADQLRRDLYPKSKRV